MLYYPVQSFPGSVQYFHFFFDRVLVVYIIVLRITVDTDCAQFTNQP